MDSLRGFGELGLGSRLKRLSETMMKEIQLAYNHFDIDFDPYLFPIIKIIDNKNGVTNTEIKDALNLSQPAITQSINKLSKKELVLLTDDVLDKRKKIISLSNKGEELVHKMKPLWQTMDVVVKEYTQHSSKSLIEHINKLEDKLQQKPLSETIIEKAKMNVTNTLEIISFKDEYQNYFYDLNIEWLETYFYVEPYDEEVLSKSKEYIINKGGHIFFAKLDGEIVGTVALMPTNEVGVFELTKMAVSPKHRGHKIGQQLMQYCIDFAKEHKLSKLILYSNTKLENAIYIYRKYGFIEVPMEPNGPYNRGNIKMEYLL